MGTGPPPERVPLLAPAQPSSAFLSSKKSRERAFTARARQAGSHSSCSSGRRDDSFQRAGIQADGIRLRFSADSTPQGERATRGAPSTLHPPRTQPWTEPLSPRRGTNPSGWVYPLHSPDEGTKVPRAATLGGRGPPPRQPRGGSVTGRERCSGLPP